MQQSDLMGQLYQQRWELFYVLCSLTQTAKLSYTKTIRLHNFQNYFSEHNCFICFPTKISRISAKPTGLLLAVFESNTPTVAYCTLWNETKQNEICTLRNEKLLWRSFCEPSISLQSFLLWHRTVSFWTADKNKTIFTAFLPQIAWTKLVLSIVLSPPLLSAPGGSALLCFATRWYLHTTNTTLIISESL